MPSPEDWVRSEVVAVPPLSAWLSYALQWILGQWTDHTWRQWYQDSSFYF